MLCSAASGVLPSTNALCRLASICPTANIGGHPRTPVLLQVGRSSRYGPTRGAPAQPSLRSWVVGSSRRQSLLGAEEPRLGSARHRSTRSVLGDALRRRGGRRKAAPPERCTERATSRLPAALTPRRAPVGAAPLSSAPSPARPGPLRAAPGAQITARAPASRAPIGRPPPRAAAAAQSECGELSYSDTSQRAGRAGPGVRGARGGRPCPLRPTARCCPQGSASARSGRASGAAPARWARGRGADRGRTSAPISHSADTRLCPRTCGGRRYGARSDPHRTVRGGSGGSARARHRCGNGGTS